MAEFKNEEIVVEPGEKLPGLSTFQNINIIYNLPCKDFGEFGGIAR